MPIYLDCASTTPLDSRVRAEMLRYLDDDFGNAGSRTHAWGLRARAAVEHARDQVAAVVGARRGDVIFTSGATESNNLAILGLAGAAQDRKHVVSTAIEHHAVLEPLAELGRRGFEITLVSPDSRGIVDPDAVAGAVRPDTVLVSIMHVNNETGVRQPVAEVADRLERSDAYLHVDAAQSFARDIDALRHPRLDLISASAHKINGPKGIGALIMRRRGQERPPLQPLMFGGGQERGLRPGTMPVALAPGLDWPLNWRLRNVTSAGSAVSRFGKRCSRACRRSAESSTGICGNRSRTSSTCRFRASKRKSRSMHGKTWWACRTEPHVRRSPTPVATC